MGGGSSGNSGLWLQPPSISVAPSSPGPADQIRMIFGTQMNDHHDSLEKIHENGSRTNGNNQVLWN